MSISSVPGSSSDEGASSLLPIDCRRKYKRRRLQVSSPPEQGEARTPAGPCAKMGAFPGGLSIYMSAVRALAALVLPLSFVALKAADASLPSADEIVQKYITARGGLEKIHAIDTMKMTGTADFNGQMQGAITVQTKRPNLFRFDMNLPSGSVVQAFDGTTSWGINPFTGSASPRKDADSDSQA